MVNRRGKKKERKTTLSEREVERPREKDTAKESEMAN